MGLLEKLQISERCLILALAWSWQAVHVALLGIYPSLRIAQEQEPQHSELAAAHLTASAVTSRLVKGDESIPG